MFGYPADIENPKAYWGARAIKEQGGFSLLPDRQGASGEEGDKLDLLKWVNKKLPDVRKWAKGQTSSSREVHVVTEAPYVLKASCNASFGYVYVGAWVDEGLRLKSQYEGKVVGENRYGLKSVPEGKWSGQYPIPAIGERVMVTINGLGEGIVCAYFCEKGAETLYVGVEVSLEKQPDWHKKQCGIGKNALVFGVETRAVSQVAVASGS